MKLSDEKCPCGLKVWNVDGAKTCPACGDLEPVALSFREYAAMRFKCIAYDIGAGRYDSAKRLAEQCARAVER